MAQKVVMPKLGLTMTEGKIVKWHKKVGDKVTKGEVIFEVETEKITNEVEANIDGKLAKIVEGEGATVPITEVVAVIAESGEDIDKIAANYCESENNEQEAEEKREVKKKSQKQKDKKVRVSPKAKRFVKEKGVEIKEVAKITDGKRITTEDIKNYLATLEEKKEESKVKETKKEEIIKEKKELSQMRLTIANRLSESWDAPHIYLRNEVEVDEIIKLRKKFKDNVDQVPSITDIISMAVIKSLKKHPNINATWEDGTYYIHNNVNLGVAVAVEEGLVVPVINGAEEHDLMEISNKVKELAKRSRENSLNLAELEGGTFTISNLGMYGIDEFTAIINPPQVAILAVGTIKEVLYRTEAGEISEKKVMNLVLGLDHRAIDGAMGAKFLQTLKNFIENPALMI